MTNNSIARGTKRCDAMAHADLAVHSGARDSDTLTPCIDQASFFMFIFALIRVASVCLLYITASQCV